MYCMVSLVLTSHSNNLSPVPPGLVLVSGLPNKRNQREHRHKSRNVPDPIPQFTGGFVGLFVYSSPIYQSLITNYLAGKL